MYRLARLRTVLVQSRAFLVLVTALQCTLAIVAFDDNKKKILVLFPDKDNQPGVIAFDSGLKQTLHTAHADVEVFSEFLESSRFSTEAYQQQLAIFLRDKYAGIKLDVVVVGLAPSLDFVLKYRSIICPGAPVVYGAIERHEVETRRIGPDVIGVPMTFALEPTLKLALQLHPHINKVYVIAGTTAFDQYWLDQARLLFKPYSDCVTFSFISDLSIKELQHFVGTLTSDSIVYYLHMLRDTSGTQFASAEVVSEIAPHSSVPIYGHIGTYLGRGIVGGQLMDFEIEGRNAARLVLQLLGGRKPHEVTFPVPVDGHYTVDWRKLKQWGIREADLPIGTQVCFEEPDFWVRYRWHVLGIVSLCVAQAILIIGLLLQRISRQKAEKKLSNSQAELIALTGRLMQAQESERRHIARELHDDLNQNLALLFVELDLLNNKSLMTKEQIKESLTKLSSHVKELSTFVHNLSHQLHPTKVEQLGLLTALRGLCRDIGVSHDLIIDFHSENVDRQIPQQVGLCLYRIAQESLRNAIKHSEADGIEVRVRQCGDELVMTIADNGIGFVAPEHQEHAGLGLLSMRERLRLVNGTFDIVSKPDEGTRIEVHVPFNQEVSSTEWNHQNNAVTA
ncbi:MAG TPA: sensor histidine kinase [Gemmatales bacterium]|nr:sensor histidine kinase [Gemmatales bacterium]